MLLFDLTLATHHYIRPPALEMPRFAAAIDATAPQRSASAQPYDAQPAPAMQTAWQPSDSSTHKVRA